MSQLAFASATGIIGLTITALGMFKTKSRGCAPELIFTGLLMFFIALVMIVFRWY